MLITSLKGMPFHFMYARAFPVKRLTSAPSSLYWGWGLACTSMACLWFLSIGYGVVLVLVVVDGGYPTALHSLKLKFIPTNMRGPRSWPVWRLACQSRDLPPFRMEHNYLIGIIVGRRWRQKVSNQSRYEDFTPDISGHFTSPHLTSPHLTSLHSTSLKLSPTKQHSYGSQ